MKKTLLALALAAAPFVSNASESNGIGYTYVQLDTVYEDFDNPYMFGGALSGSYAFTDNFFMTASYGHTKDDYDYRDSYYSLDGDLTHNYWTLGVGFNHAIGSRADWVTQAAFVRHTIKDSWHDNFGHYSTREHFNGYTISTGVLGRLTDKLNANAYLGWEDTSDDDGLTISDSGNFFADFGMVYHFNKTWGLDGGLKLSEGVETYTAGIRASF